MANSLVSIYPADVAREIFAVYNIQNNIIRQKLKQDVLEQLSDTESIDRDTFILKLQLAIVEYHKTL